MNLIIDHNSHNFLLRSRDHVPRVYATAVHRERPSAVAAETAYRQRHRRPRLPGKEKIHGKTTWSLYVVFTTEHVIFC